MRSRLLTCVVFGLLSGLAATAALAMTPQEKLGQLLYYDEYLSLNQNQACATCHHQRAGYADPENLRDPFNNVVSLGSDPTLNGGRNAPTSSYAAFTPVFDTEAHAGGQFWDGREDTLKEQAKKPFLNELEMAMRNIGAWAFSFLVREDLDSSLGVFEAHPPGGSINHLNRHRRSSS